MNTIKTFTLLVIIAVFTSCTNDDNQPQNHEPIAEDIEVSMDENPTTDLITTIAATDLDGDVLTYSIQSQTPSDSILINSTTGEVFVMDVNAFDYEQNTIIIAIISVSDGTDNTIIQLTINILDIIENS